ncbi:filamentous hemagglutinin [Burkholderia ubonensis]|nr:filamentous hemagglutinin [Burkholderia ubonensis]
MWNEARDGWTVAGETARRRGKRAIAVAASLLGLVATGAHALPTDGRIVAGVGDISMSADGKAMEVRQHTDKLITEWNDFNIAGGERVSFHQPTEKSIALNRVFGANGSQIQGQLDANGKVFLVDPNGVLFGAGAQVNVGGLIASTQDLSNDDFDAGNYRFSGWSTKAVVNEGTIIAADRGSVALLGAHVSNKGVIQAKLGRVALGAGKVFTVNFDGNDLLNLQVNYSLLEDLADNGGLLKADGGEVLMTGRAAGDLHGAVVKNTGTIEAKGLNTRNGKITLDGVRVEVGGKLDASAQEAGAPGTIATRGKRVEVANDAQVNTRAGTWTIEAENAGVNGTYTDHGSIDADTLARSLDTTNVELANMRGDLSLGAPVSWMSDNTLTLTSKEGNVDLQKTLSATGANAGLVVNAADKIRVVDAVKLTGDNAHLELNSANGHTLADNKAVVTLSGKNASFRANGEDYTVIHDLSGLRNVDVNLAGRYVLGNAIEGSGHVRSIGRNIGFSGEFDGLGNTLSRLKIENDPNEVNLDHSAINGVGLFSANSGRIGNLNLQGVTVSGVTPSDSGSMIFVGSLAGTNSGTLSNVTAKDGLVTGKGAGWTVVGGLVGMGTDGKIDRASVSGRVEGDSSTKAIGGLVGENSALISNSAADVQVVAEDAASRRSVSAGGLVGTNTGTIDKSSSKGSVQVNRNGAMAGGLVGDNFNSGVTAGTIRGSSSLSQVTAGDNAKAGGLVGFNEEGALVKQSSAKSEVIVGDNSSVGALVGENIGDIESVRVWASSKVKAGASSRAGGLVGSNNGKVLQGVAGVSEVVAGTNSQAGGLVGFNGKGGAILSSKTLANVKAGDQSLIGDLVGHNLGILSNSETRDAVNVKTVGFEGGQLP